MPTSSMLFHTPDRTRWFLVPDDAALPEGDLPVLSFVRGQRQVSPEAIAPYEVDADAAKQWVDQRFRDSFAKAGQAFGKFAASVREASRRKGRDVPFVSADRVTAEQILGMSPGDLHTDPARAKEALSAALSWASDRLRPPGPEASPPDPEALQRTLSALGDGLRTAAEQIRARQDAARQRSTPQPQRLRRVGFFAELRHGDPDGPSLAAAARPAPGPHEDDVVRYLTAAPVLIASPGPVHDVLDPTAGYIGTPSIYTDGVWCWPGDLAHYVRQHHVALPGAFLEHLMSRGWDPGEPDLSAVVF